MNLSDLRRDFGQQKDSPVWSDNPFSLFGEWLQTAINKPVQEANAMILSTAGTDNKPSSRVVLLKEYSEKEGFVFYTDYSSHKGRDLEANSFASVIFYWNVLERQIRIEGKVKKVDRSMSTAYFNSRPLESRLSAYVSRQSQRIDHLDELRQQRQELLDSGNEITCPERWGGYALMPEKFEFWQGGTHRLHHRMEYIYTGGSDWKRQALAP